MDQMGRSTVPHLEILAYTVHCGQWLQESEASFSYTCNGEKQEVSLGSLGQKSLRFSYGDFQNISFEQETGTVYACVNYTTDQLLEQSGENLVSIRKVVTPVEGNNGVGKATRVELIINFEEIDSMQRSELNQLKAMTTTLHINERPAYGRNKMRLPHVASFCATGNNLQFLNDDTGTRRWVVAEIEHIENPWNTQLPYEGIYAQAHALLRNKFRYWFDDKEIDIINRRNRRFETPNSARELILTHYRKPLPTERGRYLTASDIVSRFSPHIRLNTAQVGRALRELGYRSIHTAHGNFWHLVERTANEIGSILPEPQEED